MWMPRRPHEPLSSQTGPLATRKWVPVTQGKEDAAVLLKVRDRCEKQSRPGHKWGGI